ncbi:hypothetical protein AB3331_10805 [Streptococcus sp. H49]|uniref:hypothetical protein n=1 Tax=Streptococcus huangxiaojuni TaxID=3237239 RepID=UPI0034A17521
MESDNKGKNEICQTKVKGEKNNEVYQTKEKLYFIREGDGWYGGKCSKYSYKDFNANVSFKDYIGGRSRFQLFYKGKIISEAVLVVKCDETQTYSLNFGWITSQNEFSSKSFGGMTFLVASIIYIMLNDKGLKNQDIEILLGIHEQARKVISEKNIDVYYRIFRTPKINNNSKKISRRYIFESQNRDKDIDYFRDILILKEREILEVVSK